MASNEDSTRSPVPLPFKKRRLFSGHHASDGSDAGDNGGDDGSDGWEVPFATDPRLLAFDLSPRHALAMSGYSWAAAAKALAEDIRFGRLSTAKSFFLFFPRAPRALQREAYCR